MQQPCFPCHSKQCQCAATGGGCVAGQRSNTHGPSFKTRCGQRQSHCRAAVRKLPRGRWQFPRRCQPQAGRATSRVFKKQLNNFKVQPGQAKAQRENPIMAGFAAGLSVEDIDNVSAYLAAQTPKLGVATQKDTLKLGEKIYRGGIAEKKVPACAGCHAPNGAGIPAQYPRLAGQHAAYTNTQLVGFREGARKNNEAMTGIAKKMSDAEMKAVADYIAGLR